MSSLQFIKYISYKICGRFGGPSVSKTVVIFVGMITDYSDNMIFNKP